MAHSGGELILQQWHSRGSLQCCRSSTETRRLPHLLAIFRKMRLQFKPFLSIRTQQKLHDTRVHDQWLEKSRRAGPTKHVLLLQWAPQ